MALQCNIDSRGQLARRIWGGACLMVAIGLAGGAWAAGVWWLWILAGVAAAAGLFAWWEARRKWCAVRAMGIRTPL